MSTQTVAPSVNGSPVVPPVVASRAESVAPAVRGGRFSRAFGALKDAPYVKPARLRTVRDESSGERLEFTIPGEPREFTVTALAAQCETSGERVSVKLDIEFTTGAKMTGERAPSGKTAGEMIREFC